METLANIWKEIVNLLAEINPAVLEDLNPGANAEDFKNLEKTINVKLSDELYTLYSINNGQKLEVCGAILNGYEFLSIENIIKEWKIWEKIDEVQSTTEANLIETPAEIKNVKWCYGWIPFGADGAGNNLCIDLTPTEKGYYGQVIALYHDLPAKKLLAKNLTEYLTKFLDLLKNKQLIYDEEAYCFRKIS